MDILSPEDRASLLARIENAAIPHPEPFKYSYLTKEDIDEIIDEEGLFPEATARIQRQRRKEKLAARAREAAAKANPSARQDNEGQLEKMTVTKGQSKQPAQDISTGDAEPSAATQARALSALLALEASKLAAPAQMDRPSKLQEHATTPPTSTLETVEGEQIEK